MTRRSTLVIDDLVSVDPWKVRGIRVNGVADIVTHTGEFGKGEYIRIQPKLSWRAGASARRDTRPSGGRTRAVDARQTHASEKRRDCCGAAVKPIRMRGLGHRGRNGR